MDDFTFPEWRARVWQEVIGMYKAGLAWNERTECLVSPGSEMTVCKAGQRVRAAHSTVSVLGNVVLSRGSEHPVFSKAVQELAWQKRGRNEL